MASIVENMLDFSAKRLIENPEKAKISTTFELSHKKIMNEIYKKITEICSPDSVTMQELND